MDRPSSELQHFDAAEPHSDSDRADSVITNSARPEHKQLPSSQNGASFARRGTARLAQESTYAEMSDEERYVVANSLGRLIEHTLRSGRAVFLEGFGIVFPVTNSQHRSYAVDEKLAVRIESITTVDFEKCVELLNLHRERFGSIMETREISSRLYPSLPLLLQLRWSPDDLKRRVQGLIRAVRSEVVTNGVSRRLDKLGTFYALHNRHGATPDDWFAGADIFLSSPHRWVREVEQSVLFERPVLKNSWELFAAAFGAEIGKVEIDVVKELAAIPGFTAPELPSELRKLKLKIFKAASGPRGEATLLYCSDGIRKLAIGSDPKRAPRCELTFQLTIEAAPAELSMEDVPLWPKRAFALAAAVVAHQLLGRDSAWVGMSVPLAERGTTKLEAVLLQRLSSVATEQLSSEGEFSYVNIIGITGDELTLADELGLTHLLSLLRRKGLDLVTKLNRTSVIARTAISMGSNQPRLLPRGASPETFGAVQ